MPRARTSKPRERPDGYRLTPAGGARLRSDIVDVYVFRRATRAKRVEFLQLLRSSEPLAQTWHPVMGHVESKETCVACAMRELREELGLEPSGPDALGVWALEQVHPYYIAPIDTIVFSPRFAVQVKPAWEPRLNDEHSEYRWVRESEVAKSFMWPGQIAACAEIVSHIVDVRSLARERLRLDQAAI